MSARSKFAVVREAATGAGPLYLGLDFGTSGARATVINDAQEVVAEARTPQSFKEQAAAFPEGAPERQHHRLWHSALHAVISQLPPEVRHATACIAIDGTSATCLLACKQRAGEVICPAKMYNESQGEEAVKMAQAIAPADHTATAPTSTLCKLITWHQKGAWQQAEAPVLQHQADWLGACLHGRLETTDYNNALKLGYDPGEECYPDWLRSQPFAGVLPTEVYAPGDPVGSVTPSTAQRLGLSEDCIVCAGTTDSIAAFLAAGASEVGEAVTSLGSTLVVKLLSNARVDDAHVGVYSHRLGHRWLVGGASNTGGAVLRQHFSDEQLAELSGRIDPHRPAGLDYYPLPAPGERFPINDPSLHPRLEPRPEDDARFLQGILEGMAEIEARGYGLLHELGASQLTKVITAGGGAKNRAWTTIRAARLGVPVVPSPHTEASFGAALLARQGYAKSQQQKDNCSTGAASLLEA